MLITTKPYKRRQTMSEEIRVYAQSTTHKDIDLSEVATNGKEISMSEDAYSVLRSLKIASTIRHNFLSVKSGIDEPILPIDSEYELMSITETLIESLQNSIRRWRQ